MRIPFVKMHGLGNDFVLLDEREGVFGLEPAHFRLLADRRYGIGCDQVLSLVRPLDPAAQARYRIFNADGTPAEHCGNGVRCVARYLDRRGESRAGRVTVEIDDAVYSLTLHPPDVVRVDMGSPRFAPKAIPLAVADAAPSYRVNVDGKIYEFGAVSIGNPHAVFRVPDIEQAPVGHLGAALQQCALFPARVNAGFMQVLAPDHIRLRVFERGVGETQACGTGACAAVAVGRRWGLLAPAVTVELRGGRLRIEWDGESAHSLWMTGPATYVFQGIIEL